MIARRTRYAGDEAVERWQLKDYVIVAGLTDADPSGRRRAAAADSFLADGRCGVSQRR